MTNRNKINTLLATLSVFSLGLPSIAKAAEIAAYKLEQGIPFIGGAGQTLNYGEFSTLFQKFITAVYIIAAIAAFIKIFLAGLKWYTSGGSSKAIGQAREDIKNALMGLAFLFLAGTLLVFINPNLNKLSKVFNPNGGTQCVQGETSTNITEGSLSKIGIYYADSRLVNRLLSANIATNLSTGCTTNDGDCKPNYCEDNCQPCVLSNSKCKPLTTVRCHFNGTCVDLTPYDESTIIRLRCAGLDVLYEPTDDSCGKSTSTHLHVSLPGTYEPDTAKVRQDTNCWKPANTVTGCSNIGKGGGGGGGGF